ncbi:MAG: MarR family transcriptional regulator [Thermomicrobiales bacterium]|nr:MarR family transcriptional regulator [Thermomicrobiales bacterium]
MAQSQAPSGPDPTISEAEYQALAAFRAELRRFLRFSEEAARTVGLSPRQHQLLLAVRGHAGETPPTIGDLATALQVKHHSMVGLINRMVQAGYLQRKPSPVDQRAVYIVLTPRGEETLLALTAAHWNEHHQLERVLRRLLAQRSSTALAGTRDTAAPSSA